MASSLYTAPLRSQHANRPDNHVDQERRRQKSTGAECRESLHVGADIDDRGTLAYADEYYTNVSYEEGKFQDSYSRIDATLQLISPNDHYRISLLGRNLTEEKIVDWSILVTGTYFAWLKPPREIALTFSVDS